MHEHVFRRVDPFVAPTELLFEAIATLATRSIDTFRVRALPPKCGGTLRPGKETPLWNALRAQIRPFLRRRGSQAQLGRILGLPRQRVNDYVMRGHRMPDAERTLQLVAWLLAARAGSRPA